MGSHIELKTRGNVILNAKTFWPGFFVWLFSSVFINIGTEHSENSLCCKYLRLLGHLFIQQAWSWSRHSKYSSEQTGPSPCLAKPHSLSSWGWAECLWQSAREVSKSGAWLVTAKGHVQATLWKREQSGLSFASKTTVIGLHQGGCLLVCGNAGFYKSAWF